MTEAEGSRSERQREGTGFEDGGGATSQGMQL